MATTVTEAFAILKSNLEITNLQEATVSTRQLSVRKSLESDLIVLDSFLTGSYSRHTMIAPLTEADVDVFVVLDPSYYEAGGQAKMLDLVKSTLKKTFPRTPDISRNGQAVTIQFNDFAVDVVPSFYRKGGGYLIPNSTIQTWIATDPKKHVEIVTEANAKHGSNFIPLVKMIKCWNRCVGRNFHSFHLEVMALQVLENVRISDFPSGARYFFDKSRDFIKTENLDPAGYGGDVGAYINTNAKIQNAVNRFETALEKALRAEDYERRGYISQAIETWKIVFGDYFPSYG
jgi:hypothetical protein